jgi:hypothetical protein
LAKGARARYYGANATSNLGASVLAFQHESTDRNHPSHIHS